MAVTATTTPIGQRLRDHRAELGISQERAAVQLNTSSVSYGKWENGDAIPMHLKWVPRIALWLGTDRNEVANLIVASMPPDAPLDSQASRVYLNSDRLASYQQPHFGLDAA